MLDHYLLVLTNIAMYVKCYCVICAANYTVVEGKYAKGPLKSVELVLFAFSSLSSIL